MAERENHLNTAEGQRDVNILLGRIVCISESIETDLHDLLTTDMLDTKDLQKIVEYCFKQKKNTLVLYHLPMALWSELTEDQLRFMYNGLEVKRINLNELQKGLDNLDAPRYERLKMLLKRK